MQADIQNHKLVVYTAIFGGKDYLKDPPYVDKQLDYVCFTDDPELRSSVYNIVLRKPEFESPVKSAKIYKLLPHLFFPGHPYSLWVDASVVIKTDDMQSWLRPHLEKNPFTVFQKVKRTTLMDEVQYLKDTNKAEGKDLDKQVAFYTQEGLPSNEVMVNGCTILRAHNDPQVVTFDELWWEQVNKYTMRDEVSFP